MFLVSDITNFIDSFISLLLTGVISCFNILSDITFHGISLLEFNLAILLIGLGITIFINVVQSGSKQAVAERRNFRESKRSR